MITYVGMLAQANSAIHQLLSNACKAYALELSKISSQYQDLEDRHCNSSMQLKKPPTSKYKTSTSFGYVEFNNSASNNNHHNFQQQQTQLLQNVSS